MSVHTPLHPLHPLHPLRARASLLIVTLGLGSLFTVGPAVIGTSPASATPADCYVETPGATPPAGVTAPATLSGAYQIGSRAELLWVSWATTASNNGSSPTRTTALNATYTQTADIDLGGCNFQPIAAGEYPELSYDGGGNTISGLTINESTTEAVGLFSRLSGKNTIKNLGVLDASVTGTGANSQVGVIVGDVNAFSGNVTITSVMATGTVTGGGSSTQTGGLVGNLWDRNSKIVTLSNSFSRVAVTGSAGTGSHAGGIVGNSQRDTTATVIYLNNYSAGAVSGLSQATTGGLLGNYTSLSAVFTDTANFWDAQVSGPTRSPTPLLGTGKTTAEMKTLATFSAWDIADGWEAFTFTTPTNYWGICSQANDGYPFLLWQYTEDPCVDPPAPPAAATASAVAKPALHLDLQSAPRDTVTGAPVLIEGEGLKPGSGYSLVVRSTPVTVRSGVVGANGRFSHQVSLPSGIAPGTHTVTLAATGSDGTALSLVTTFVVSSAGTFTTISPAVGTSVAGLAATGPNTSALTIGITFSLVLLALGFIVMASPRRLNRRVS